METNIPTHYFPKKKIKKNKKKTKQTKVIFKPHLAKFPCNHSYLKSEIKYISQPITFPPQKKKKVISKPHFKNHTLQQSQLSFNTFIIKN